MKIVTIVGSPAGLKGNTAALARVLLQGAESRGAEAEVVTIRGGEIKPCRGCNSCHRKGVCPRKDAFGSVLNKVMAADGLVLASPNYIFHVSAQLKAFIDRCSSVVHCLGFEGKYGASVVTSGGGDEKPITEYLEHFLAVTGAVPVGSVWATMSQIDGQDFPDEIREKAFGLGERLVEAWENKATVPEWDRTTARFRERMRSLMLWRREEWPYEYEYWKRFRSLDDRAR